MITKEIDTLSIGNIVADDFRAAEIFKNAGIDFCCGGKKTLEQACAEKGISSASLAGEIMQLADSEVSPAQNFNEWKLDFLCDYIMNTHHKYVLKTLPSLSSYTQKVASVHGMHHPELIEVATIFEMIRTELLQHLRNEEEVLFPAIREAMATDSADAKDTIISEITRMDAEHEAAGGAMDKINVITKGYQIPADACNTYSVAFKLLHQFEDDLHTHVHLENNILYLKAIKLAKK